MGWLLLAAFTVVLQVVIILLRIFLWPLYYWKRKGVPETPGARVVFGNIADTIMRRKQIGEVYADIYRREQGKRYVGFFKFNQPAILVRDPELVKRVIETDFQHFPSNEVEGDVELDPMFGRHLFALSGERWSRLRSGLMQAFSKNMLREIFGLIPDVCDVLKARVDRKVKMMNRVGTEAWSVELKEFCTDFTTSSMATCALGVPCDTINHPEEELRRMVRLLLEPTPEKVVSHLIFLHLPRLARLLKIPFVPREVTEYFRRIVGKEVRRREEGNIHRNDYMQMFIRLWKDGKLSLDSSKEQCQRGNNGGRNGGDAAGNVPGNQPINLLDLDDITAVAVAFMSDGTVTTASVLSFAFFELAHNPDVQDKARKEVQVALGRHAGLVTLAALQEMPYLDLVLLEVLRHYPTAPFMVRKCAKQYQLPAAKLNSTEGGHILEKGIPVVVPTLGIHMDNEYYPDAEAFKPNRFSKEPVTENKPFTYYPYGEGPRICIGFKFGLLLAKTALANMLPSFQFLPSDKTSRPITLDPRYFITVSKGGLWIQMKKID